MPRDVQNQYGSNLPTPFFLDFEKPHGFLAYALLNSLLKTPDWDYGIFQNMMLLTSWGIIATVLQNIVLKTSYFGLLMEKQSEYLVIGDRFAIYGMVYSHEILANF